VVPLSIFLQQLYSAQKRLTYDAASKSGRITYHAARNDHKMRGCLPRLATELGTGRVKVEVSQTQSIVLKYLQDNRIWCGWTLRIAHLYRVLSNPCQTRPDQLNKTNVCASDCRELISKKVPRKCPCTVGHSGRVSSYDSFRDILLTVMAITWEST